MSPRRRLFVVTLICAAVIALLVALSARESSSESSGAVVPAVAGAEAQRVTLSDPAPEPLWSGLEEAIEAENQRRYFAYVEYVAAVEEIQRQEAAAAAERRAARKREAAAQAKTTAHSAPAPSGDVWWSLAGCETGGKYDNPNTGNGYFGYFQFDLSTWQGVGGPGYPHHHSYETQKSYAQKLQAKRGWSPWPHCSKKLGLRR